jgi:tetratricopeptide (TPR) repeat protein
MTLEDANFEEAGQQTAERRTFEKLQDGIDLFEAKEWDKALKAFLAKNLKELDSEEKMEYDYYLGLCYAKLNRHEDALNYLEQVVTMGSDIMRVYQCRMTLAYIYVTTKRFRMAEFELNRLKNSGLESTMLYNTLAYAAWCQKRNPVAVEYYEKALEIDTNNATAMNSMGYILADSGLDVSKGLRLCRRAVDIRPECAAYLDSLGWAYHKNGDDTEARAWLRRALDIAPKEKEIIRHFKIVTGEPL